MAVLLVRHARAGNRRQWEGDDRDRPLTKKGHQQAQRLASLLGPYGPERILSSPYTRCVQTLEPLAAQLALPIEPADELMEGRGVQAVRLLRSLAGQAVVTCTHGDVVHEVLGALAGLDGLSLPRSTTSPKASTWVFEAANASHSCAPLTSALYLPPPDR